MRCVIAQRPARLPCGPSDADLGARHPAPAVRERASHFRRLGPAKRPDFTAAHLPRRAHAGVSAHLIVAQGGAPRQRAGTARCGASATRVLRPDAELVLRESPKQTVALMRGALGSPVYIPIADPQGPPAAHGFFAVRRLRLVGELAEREGFARESERAKLRALRRSPSERRLRPVGAERRRGPIRTLGTVARTHDFQSCTFGRSLACPNRSGLAAFGRCAPPVFPLMRARLRLRARWGRPSMVMAAMFQPNARTSTAKGLAYRAAASQCSRWVGASSVAVFDHLCSPASCALCSSAQVTFQADEHSVPNDHDIPRFLTKPWEHAQGNDERQLTYFYFQTRRFVTRSSRLLFAQRGLNSTSVEAMLGRVVESPIGVDLLDVRG